MSFRRLLLFLPLSFTLAFTARGESLLHGHYRYSDKVQTSNIYFNNDGTYTGSYAQHGKTVWEFAGDWSLVGDKLNYKFTSSSVKKIPVGTVDHDRVVEIREDYYIIQNRAGRIIKYVRNP